MRERVHLRKHTCTHVESLSVSNWLLVARLTGLLILKLTRVFAICWGKGDNYNVK